MVPKSIQEAPEGVSEKRHEKGPVLERPRSILGPRMLPKWSPTGARGMLSSPGFRPREPPGAPKMANAGPKAHQDLNFIDKILFRVFVLLDSVKQRQILLHMHVVDFD